jgi:NitT/TauT family transport system ATP-binding protein
MSSVEVESGTRAGGPKAEPTGSPLIVVDALTKQYVSRSGPILALDNVKFTVATGEFLSVIGPSGCGKSTLLMIVAGLTTASGGTVVIGERRVEGPYTDLGIVFQEDVLLDWRTVLQNTLLQADIRGTRTHAAEARARELLAMVGLAGFEAKYPHELSGGMRQRVSICRALLHDPPLLLMDEPFGALDALTRDQMNLDLLRFWEKLHMTVLFVTHSISEAVFLSDRVIVMSPRPGKIEDIIPIDLPRPRRLTMRDSSEFTGYARAVRSVFERVGVLKED